ncbi:MAG TPA: hypothetical protein VFO86_05315 [Terriglobia bacterium]|nr:hypothetical protein [Terriglobia bacterium]
MRKLNLLCFALVFSAFIATSTLKGGVQQATNSAFADDGRRQDVYAIYSQIMSNPPTSFRNDANTTYAIEAMTVGKTPKPAQPPAGDLAEFMARIDGDPCVVPPKPYEGRWSGVLAEYNAGAPSVPLERSLSIVKPYVLLTTGVSTPLQDVRDIFRLTNVYFNKDRTLALAGVGTTCGSLCGIFQWLILERSPEGRWKTVTPE